MYLLILTFFINSLPSSEGAGSAVLDTSYGQMTGKVLDLGLNGRLPIVSQYLGVPYGMPPVGNRRFLPPQNAAKWLRNTKDATKLPPVCIQNFPDITNSKDALKRMTMERLELLRKLRDFVKDQREDCLFMNLYVPVLNKGGSHAEKLPIVVLVHGESFEWNAGNPYDGSVLASYGEVIFVTLNYRLGALGFLSSGDPIISGNRALHDILAALNMIHMLAPDFGGDTSRVTLLGFGTGAAMANLLLSAPPSLPGDIQLFHRVILLGGSALSKWALIDNPREYLYLFAERVGCPTTAPNKFGIPEFLSPAALLPCLRQVPVDNITNAQRKMPHPTYMSTFAPVLDGIFVVKEPQENFRFHGDLYHRYDVLFGVNKNEAYSLLSESDVADGIDIDGRKKIFRTLVRNLFSFHRSEIFEAIINEYTDWSNPSLEPAEIRDEVLSALSDGLFIAPLIQAAQLHAQNEQSPTPSSRTYLFVNGHQTRENGMKGSITNEDFPYILGYPLTRPGQLNIPYNVSIYTSRDKIISEMLMRYISNFAKSGDPNSPVEPGEFLSDGANKLQDKVKALKWPSFDVPAGKDQYLSISDKPKTGSFYRANEVAFWTKFLPKLHRQLEGHADAEHHFLPRHREQSSFFGEVFPLGGYYSAPFTPPPLPPPAIPDEVLTTLATKKKSADEGGQGTPSSAADATGPTAKAVQAGNYNIILSVTVAVGCALLILNILVFAGVYHQKDKKKRRKKQQSLQYHSYNSTGNYLNSPITHVGGGYMQRAPQPSMSSNQIGESNSLDGGGMILQLTAPMPPGGDASAHPTRSGAGFPEQEPLLTHGSLSNPTCPRHGRSPARSMLEEVQV